VKVTGRWSRWSCAQAEPAGHPGLDQRGGLPVRAAGEVGQWQADAAGSRGSELLFGQVEGAFVLGADGGVGRSPADGTREAVLDRTRLTVPELAAIGSRGTRRAEERDRIHGDIEINEKSVGSLLHDQNPDLARPTLHQAATGWSNELWSRTDLV
jgi:hypothetical protein